MNDEPTGEMWCDGENEYIDELELDDTSELIRKYERGEELSVREKLLVTVAMIRELKKDIAALRSEISDLILKTRGN